MQNLTSKILHDILTSKKMQECLTGKTASSWGIARQFFDFRDYDYVHDYEDEDEDEEEEERWILNPEP